MAAAWRAGSARIAAAPDPAPIPCHRFESSRRTYDALWAELLKQRNGAKAGASSSGSGGGGGAARRLAHSNSSSSGSSGSKSSSRVGGSADTPQLEHRHHQHRHHQHRRQRRRLLQTGAAAQRQRGQRQEQRPRALPPPRVLVNVIGSGNASALALAPELAGAVRLYRDLGYADYYDTICRWVSTLDARATDGMRRLARVVGCSDVFGITHALHPPTQTTSRARSIALLPLFNAASGYLRDKISSSVLASVATGTPLLAPPALLATYSWMAREHVLLMVGAGGGRLAVGMAGGCRACGPGAWIGRTCAVSALP